MLADFTHILGSSGKEPTCQCRRHKRCGLNLLVGNPLEEGMDPPLLEEGMASHFSILAWRIPWTEEPGGLQCMESQRAGHNLSDLAYTHVYSS